VCELTFTASRHSTYSAALSNANSGSQLNIPSTVMADVRAYAAACNALRGSFLQRGEGAGVFHICRIATPRGKDYFTSANPANAATKATTTSDTNAQCSSGQSSCANMCTGDWLAGGTLKGLTNAITAGSSSSTSL
jgi:hypothetical protein